jgi:hypothetical protein
MSLTKGLAFTLDGVNTMTTATATKTRKSSMLAKGAIVTFSVVPPGSYLTPGRTYLVINTDRRAIHFRDEVSRSATFDPRWAIDRSTFAVAS